MPVDRQTTKDRLLDAAESLFAEKDFQDVSIRELAAAAEVNVAAVNYHYQGKDNLIREVVTRRFIVQRERSLNALAALNASCPDGPDIAQVVRTLVREHLSGALEAPGLASFMGLMSRETDDTPSGTSGPFFKELVAPVFGAYSRALIAARPGLDQEQVNWLLASIVGQVHHFIMRRLKSRNLAPDSDSRDFMLKAFPALALPTAPYIEQVTEHITCFSTAAIDGLFPEVTR